MTGKTKDKIFGCGEGGHAGGRAVGAREEAVFDRSLWILRCGDHWWEKLTEEDTV